MKPEMKQILVVGSVLIVATLFLFYSLSVHPVKRATAQLGEVERFNSVEEIRKYIEDNSAQNNYYGGIAKSLDSYAPSAGMAEGSVRTDAVGGSDQGGNAQANEHSNTNVQVDGVDEPDIVKNDGKYLYVVSGNTLSILDAFPAENMKILDTLDFKADSVSNIFVNGDKMVVFVNHYEYVDSGIRCDGIFALGVRCGGYSKEEARVYVYDISDRSDAKLDNEYDFSGNYVDARMVGNYVYLIAQKYVYQNDFVMPYVKANGVEKIAAPTDIYYFPQHDDNYVFNTVAAIDLDSGDSNSETYLMGASGATYVSEHNIYMSYQSRLSQDYIVGRYLDEVLLPTLPSRISSNVESVWNDDSRTEGEKEQKIGEVLQDYLDEMSGDERFEFQSKLEDKAFDFFKSIQKEQDQTKVHRIAFDKLDISHEATGLVAGTILNQFSMDEFDGNLRIATTTGGWQSDENENNLYVLNEDLEVIGKVEGLAQGERVYSARFMGETAYLVTFRQTDPLFAIDLSDPTNPSVEGELKVTGYSGYLHPYDKTHLIGIGMDASEDGRVSGLKVSLFDVNDISNPKEIGTYNFDEQWSSSDALYDYKAVLFDKDKNLLVIPVSYSKNWQEGTIWHYDYWQGVYVFNVNTNGIDLRGKITHQKSNTQDYAYGGYVRRSVFMDDALYTISDQKVKVNDLNTLDEIKTVDLPNPSYGGRPIPYADVAKSSVQPSATLAGSGDEYNSGVAEPAIAE